MRLIALSLFVLAACANSATPTPTMAACPDPDPMSLTWDSFGMQFMTTYCTDCHASDLKHTQRNGAPLYHDYDTLMGVLETPEHVDEYAGSGLTVTNTEMPPSQCPTMPGGSLNRDCPQPTEEERKNLSIWLACEQNRPH